MKAGAFTPVILSPSARYFYDATARSMKAGAFTPAIRTITRDGDGAVIRSMKAGAFTPAILLSHVTQPGSLSFAQ